MSLFNIIISSLPTIILTIFLLWIITRYVLPYYYKKVLPEIAKARAAIKEDRQAETIYYAGDDTIKKVDHIQEKQ